jgi:non-ribosomal peptide synthetase component F
MVIGGEAARPARPDDWRSLDGADVVRLVNTYGCTETTLVTHAIDLHGPQAEWPAGPAVPLGRALPHLTERIGDDGELLIGGPSVALGYRGMPAATGERFASAGIYDVTVRRADGTPIAEFRGESQSVPDNFFRAPSTC